MYVMTRTLGRNSSMQEELQISGLSGSTVSMNTIAGFKRKLGEMG